MWHHYIHILKKKSDFRPHPIKVITQGDRLAMGSCQPSHITSTGYVSPYTLHQWSHASPHTSHQGAISSHITSKGHVSPYILHEGAMLALRSLGHATKTSIAVFFDIERWDIQEYRSNEICDDRSNHCTASAKMGRGGSKMWKTWKGRLKAREGREMKWKDRNTLCWFKQAAYWFPICVMRQSSVITDHRVNTTKYPFNRSWTSVDQNVGGVGVVRGVGWWLGTSESIEHQHWPHMQ